jgi:hypothetical protein
MLGTAGQMRSQLRLWQKHGRAPQEIGTTRYTRPFSRGRPRVVVRGRAVPLVANTALSSGPRSDGRQAGGIGNFTARPNSQSDRSGPPKGARSIRLPDCNHGVRGGLRDRALGLADQLSPRFVGAERGIFFFPGWCAHILPPSHAAYNARSCVG